MDGQDLVTAIQVVFTGLMTLLAAAMKSAATKGVEEQATRDKGNAAILTETKTELERTREALGESSEAVRASIAAQTLAAERDARAAEAAYTLSQTVDRLATEVTRSMAGVTSLASEIHDATTESNATRRSYDSVALECRAVVASIQRHMAEEEKVHQDIIRRLP